MNYDEFFIEAAEKRIHIPIKADSIRSTPLLSNEALFQLPLLAMVLLILGKGKKKPELAEVGQLLGECLERTVIGFKGSSQHIGWSANLRIRTVKALTFLEASGLAVVDRRTQIVNTTEKGRTVLDSALNKDGLLANTLMTIERSYQNIAAETKIKMELS